MFAADNFSESLSGWILSFLPGLPAGTVKSVSVIVITLILSYFTLVFGELVPKRLAMRKAQDLSLKMSGMLKIISVVFAPLVKLLSVSTNLVLRLLGIDPNEPDKEAGEEEIALLVESGSIEPQEKEMIANVFDLNDLSARELATHQWDTVVLKTGQNLDEWTELLKTTPHTFYPVINPDGDTVEGLIRAREFFMLDPRTMDEAEELIQPALIVPESAKADDVLSAMKTHHQKAAVLLDEYGSFEGILTLQDIIDELVGDLEEDSDLKQIDHNIWEIFDNISVLDLEEVLDIEIQTDADTVSGMIIEQTSSMPAETEYEFADFTISVDEIDSHVVKHGTIRKKNA